MIMISLMVVVLGRISVSFLCYLIPHLNTEVCTNSISWETSLWFGGHGCYYKPADSGKFLSYCLWWLIQVCFYMLCTNDRPVERQAFFGLVILFRCNYCRTRYNNTVILSEGLQWFHNCGSNSNYCLSLHQCLGNSSHRLEVMISSSVLTWHKNQLSELRAYQRVTKFLFPKYMVV